MGRIRTAVTLFPSHYLVEGKGGGGKQNVAEWLRAANQLHSSKPLFLLPSEEVRVIDEQLSQNARRGTALGIQGEERGAFPHLLLIVLQQDCGWFFSPLFGPEGGHLDLACLQIYLRLPG